MGVDENLPPLIAIISLLLINMGILEFLVILLVLGWFFGGAFAIGGNLLNLLIVIAVILIVYRLVKGERL